MARQLPARPGFGEAWRPRLVEAQVDGGTAVIEPDLDRPYAATLFVDGTFQSHVDLGDPTFLCFEYVQHIGVVLDTVLPAESARSALRLLHLGGGALTIPRYVATTRPGSQHRVAEIDGPLVELVRAELPLDPRHRIRISTTDARALVTRTRPSSVDAVVVDVFAGARVLPSLLTTEFFEAAATTLTPTGALVMNVVDKQPLTFARRLIRSAGAAFASIAVAAEPAVWRGRRFGNLVLVAAQGEQPVVRLSSRLAGGPFPARLVHGAALSKLVGDARPMRDADGVQSPEPPPNALGLPIRAGDPSRATAPRVDRPT